MLRLIAAVGIIAVLVTTTEARAQEPTRDSVRQMLSAYEGGPTAEQWRALGPATVAVLVDLYNDAEQPPYVRLRAVAAVAHFPSPATRTFLLAVARARGQGDLFIREAVLALGRAFGPEAVRDVKPFLQSRHPVVREAAGRALGSIATAAAVSAIREQLAVERDPAVRDTLERSLHPTPTARP